MDNEEQPSNFSHASINEPISYTLTWRMRITYLYAPILAMVFSLFITLLIVIANPFLDIGIFPPLTNLYETIIALLVIALVGGVATFATFLVFQRGSETLHRIIIAAFISPLFFILTVFIGQAIFLVLLFQGLTNLHLSMIALASIMFSAFSMVFIFTDALGMMGRNVLFTIYGIILGVFIATNFTWVISMALLVILAIQDTIFAIRLGPTIVDADPQRHARAAFTFVIGPLIIGVGDLIVYAALVSYALRYVGWTFAILTFAAVLTGCLINTQIVVKRPNQVIPGLPIPLLCALLPISIGLALIFLGFGGVFL
ncbi:MAG: hypothetical protein ACFFBR_00100 [Promethearchaeota archaeon]